MTAVTIQGEKTSTGYRYTIAVTIRESTGVGLSVTTADFTFLAGGSTTGSVHFDNPFSAKVAGNTSATSKTLTVTDDNAGHSYATHLNTVVSFTDDNQNAGTANGSDDIASLPQLPIINEFSISRSGVQIGDVVTLTWSVSGATAVSISPGVGTVSSSGQRTVTPLADTSYTLSATNPGGTTTSTASVSVDIPSGLCSAAGLPSGTTAICNDGDRSQSQNRTGTCSSHGGVRCWVCPGALCSG